MHTPHPTSPQPAALRRRSAPQAPARIWRRSRLALAGALALLVLLVAAGPAAALSTEYAFTVTGHGWGHGVGMSQWGAYGYAKHGWDYKQILKHYYTGISFSEVADSVVRVNLRSGQRAVKADLRQGLHRQGHRRGLVDTGRHDGDHHPHGQRLPRRRGLPAQDIHRSPDLHADGGLAQPHHQDRPR